MSEGLEEFEARLRRLAAVADPVPRLVVESGRAAFALRTLDAELAELVHDSAVDAELVLVRGPGDDVRMLSFEHGSVAVDVQVSETPDGCELLGLVTGAAGDVELEQGGARVPVPLDAAGRFVVRALPPGPVRLHVRAADGTAVATSWVTL
ncbi:MAG TPA: hypothetical protein VMI11_12475 [Actinomycetes bacterium]|nr:hypothetical protein [Actinomycetes bacterium]